MLPSLLPSLAAFPNLDRSYRWCFSGGRTLTHLHAGADPHLFDRLLVLHDEPSGFQDLTQRFHDPFKRRLGTFLLHEARNGNVGAAAAVEEGVKLGG